MQCPPLRLNNMGRRGFRQVLESRGEKEASKCEKIKEGVSQ